MFKNIIIKVAKRNSDKEILLWKQVSYDEGNVKDEKTCIN